MMRVDATAGTEEMLGCSRIEPVARQDVPTLENFYPIQRYRGDDRSPHAAIRAVAATDGLKAVAERHFKAYRTTVAAACPIVLTTCHDLFLLSTNSPRLRHRLSSALGGLTRPSWKNPFEVPLVR